MPIERTKEMDDAFHAAAWHPNWGGGDPDWQAGLDAVLALVERNYSLSPYCNAELMPGVACKRLAGTRHKHEALLPTGSRVEWT